MCCNFSIQMLMDLYFEGDRVTLERRNPLLDNGSLTHASMEMQIHGARTGTQRAFISTESTNNFHGYAQATKIFYGYALDYKSGRQRRLIQHPVWRWGRIPPT
jgi:hypothetical protein